MGGRLLALFLLGQVSCVTVSTTTVRVREPGQVDLKREDSDEVIIASGAPAATVPVHRGTLWNWYEQTPFQVDAIREPTGALRLQCDVCAVTPWPKRGRGAALLVNADGTVMPSVGRAAITRAAIRLPYEICFVRGGRKHQFCEVESRTTVTVPWDNVVVANRSTSPVRIWGTVMVSFGAFEIATGVLVLSPVFGEHGYTQRAAFGIPVIATGAVALAFGLWHLLAPTREEQIFAPGQPGSGPR